MFKLNVDFSKASFFVYMLCSFNALNDRICHVNKRVIKNMGNLELILILSLSEFEKCEYCNQAKITRTSHKSVSRNSEPFELIHSDLCEFDGV